MSLLGRFRRSAVSQGAPVASVNELERAKAAAIERSGWGVRFVAFQPRNAAFWVFWAVVVTGAWQAFTMFSVVPTPFVSTIAASGLILVLYAALFWWATHTMDRYSTLPVALVVHAFVWGALAATFAMALFANDAILDIYGKVFGQRWAATWGAGLTAPITEEVAKGLGLVLLMALAPRIVRTAFDAFILGAFLGLGFQVLEDVLYVAQNAGQQFGTDPWAAGLQVLVLRMLTGVAGHIAYSAIFATGLLLLIGTPAQPRRIGRGVALVVTAMILHGVWDDMGGIVGRYVLLVIVLEIVMTVLALFIVTRVFRFAVRGERADMRAVLAPEAADGVVLPDEVAAATGDRKARRRFVRAGANRRQRRLRRALLEAIHDLADVTVTVDDLDTLTHARVEVARIRDRSRLA
jgi:RsiW-degrading membrane proteinase PrsW (M82 family)